MLGTRSVRVAAVLTSGLLLHACASGGASAPAVTPARQPAFLAETAGSAAAFVDSVGVNVHLGYSNTPYGRQPQRIAALVAKLGVRHLRDGTYPGQSNVCALDQAFAASGVHFDFIVSPAETDAQLGSWQTCSAPAAESYEGYNEYDLSGDPNWVADLRAAQTQIYAYGHGLGLPVIGPSLTSESAYGAVGPVPADNGNMHDYFAARNPGTSGWGGTDGFGTYGSLAYDMAIAQQTTGQAPMWSTETGYGDLFGTPYFVPAATKMRYSLRTLLVQWNAGVPRTYLYELVDEGGGSFGSYGLTNAATEPKPVFNALAALLAHLSAKNSAPATLQYSLAAGSTIDHSLFAMEPGHFVLALWEEVPEWNPNSNEPIHVSPVPATVSFANAPSQLEVTTFADDGKATTQKLAPRNSANFSVDGGLTLVDIFE